MTQKIKFLHLNQEIPKTVSRKFFNKMQSRTVAVNIFMPEFIKFTAAAFLCHRPDSNEDIYVRIFVGVSFVSRKDNYSKKIGRAESMKAMKEINLKVIGTVVTETHIFIKLESHQGISLNLRLNKKSGFSTVVGNLTCED